MLFCARSNRTNEDAKRFAPSSFSALTNTFADVAFATSVFFMCALIAIIISIPLAIIISAIIIFAIIMREMRALPSKR